MCIMRNLSYHVHKEVPGADRYQEAEPGIPGSATASQRRRKDDASCFGGKKAKGGWVRLGRVPFPAQGFPCPWQAILEAGRHVVRLHGHTATGKVRAQGPALILSCGVWGALRLCLTTLGKDSEHPQVTPPGSSQSTCKAHLFPSLGQAPSALGGYRFQIPMSSSSDRGREAQLLPAPDHRSSLGLMGTEPPSSWSKVAVCLLGLLGRDGWEDESWEGTAAQAPLLSPVLPPAAQRSGSIKVSPCSAVQVWQAQ